jgi:hypothetical protein
MWTWGVLRLTGLIELFLRNRPPFSTLNRQGENNVTKKFSALLALIFVFSIGQFAFAQNTNSNTSNTRRSERREERGEERREERHEGRRRRKHKARKHVRREDRRERGNRNGNANR